MNINFKILIQDTRKLLVIGATFGLTFALLNLVSFLFLLAFLLSLPGIRKIKFNYSHLGSSYFFFILIPIFSFFWSINIDLYLKDLEKQAVYLVPLIFFSFKEFDRKLYLNLIKVFFVGVTLCLLTTFVLSFDVMFFNEPFWVKGITREQFLVNDFYSLLHYFRTSFLFFEHHNTYFSFYLIYSTVIILQFRIINSLFLKVVILIINIVLILALQSIIIYVICCGWLVFYFFRNSQAYNRFFVGLCLLIIFISAVYSGRFEAVVHQLNNLGELKKGTLVERVQQLECSWTLIKERPLLGVGLGQVSPFMKDIAMDKGYDLLIIRNYFSIHNQYVFQAVSYGLIGLLVFFWMIASLLIYASRSRNHLLFQLILVSLTVFMVEGFLNRSSGSILIVLLCCIFMKINSVGNES
ncbi:O-antigen ligase family protein [Cytophagales bacterium LB-30]|uniref:O-antigen ligase family protein n=1 Tax=Shiella aurantiaca TaxID=3058365 RepID=A0ABT8F2J5_9BACT|nr:O-antigen ligase family protein [Shiella aurantiaca]MDN4164630.1 O-antigen ligase family protein [Shiella aurantiaca]